MDEVNTTQPVPDEKSEMSSSDKLMNVFSAPGELFEEVARSEKKNSNWSVPLILTIVVSVIFVLVAFSQAPIQDQMREQTEKTIQKQVSAGKMTQEQADMALTKNPAQPGSPLFMIFGSIGAAVVMVVMLFGFSLVFWLMGKWVFKASAAYGKVLEVTGLSMYITVLGSIVTLLLVVAMGSLYTNAQFRARRLSVRSDKHAAQASKFNQRVYILVSLRSLRRVGENIFSFDGKSACRSRRALGVVYGCLGASQFRRIADYMIPCGSTSTAV